jgi:glycosyltransferase involved in cell wall biosynthesis
MHHSLMTHATSLAEAAATPLFSRPITLGVIANEFLDADPSLGGAGGFGWASRQIAKVFSSRPTLGVQVVFLHVGVCATRNRDVVESDGIQVYLRQGGRTWYRAPLVGYRERIDVLLSIDYRPNYDTWFWAMPRTPVIVWSRDPRTEEDVQRINSLRVPGHEAVAPQGIRKIDCTGLARVVRFSKRLRRRVIVANKMPHLRHKTPETYGLPPSDHELPNPDVTDYSAPLEPKSDRPRVVYLGRLDPIKRPWLFIELARHFPGVDFLVMGQPFFAGSGAWQPENLPDNVQLLGHVRGQQKIDILASAWALVNTSIHEESPVSVLEALACETPVLSCTDWGEIATRFGVFVGRFDGAGMDAVPALASGLSRLLNNERERRDLGRLGAEWVRSQHNTDRFIGAFRTLCHELRVRAIGNPRPGQARAYPKDARSREERPETGLTAR